MDLTVLREQLAKFSQDKLLPVTENADLNGEFPLDVFHEFSDLGLGAVYLPEDCGGADSLEGLFLVVEELSRVNPGFALSTMASYQLFGYNVARMGTPAQKEEFLKPLIHNRKIGCWALTEPDIGSDAVHVKTTAKKDGDDYILNGSKTFITNAPISDFFIIIANSGGEGIQSGSAFLLKKGTEGLSVSKPFKKFGHRCSPTGQIFLENVRVPVAHRLGEEGKGFFDMKHSLEIERLLVGPMVAGMLKTLIEKSVVYAYQRQQFGQPILMYQLVQEKIANMKMHLEMIEAATEKGISRLKDGQSVKTMATALKLYAAQVGTQMGLEAMQIHGGNGYTHEYGVEMFMRDAKLMEIGGGTNEMMKQILAKDVIKEVGRQYGVL